MRFFHHIIFLSLVLLMAGCLTPDTPKTPDWVEHPPEATPQELYGVSVASSLPKTVLSAIGGLATSVYDAAQEPLKAYPLDQQQKHLTQKAMKNVLASLDYDGIEVKQEVKMGKNVAVMIAMERADLIAQLSKKLQAHIDRLEAEIIANTDVPFFRQLAVLGKVNEEHPAILAQIVLLQTADPFADIKPYLAFIKKTKNSYSHLKFTASVTVISDANAIALVEPLKKAFIAEGIKTANIPDRTNDKRGTVLLQADRQREKTAGGYALKIRLQLKTKTASETIATSEHYYQAVSRKSYKDAETIIAKTFASDIRENGLFHVLGF